MKHRNNFYMEGNESKQRKKAVAGAGLKSNQEQIQAFGIPDTKRRPLLSSDSLLTHSRTMDGAGMRACKPPQKTNNARLHQVPAAQAIKSSA